MSALALPHQQPSQDSWIPLRPRHYRGCKDPGPNWIQRFFDPMNPNRTFFLRAHAMYFIKYFFATLNC